LVASRAARSTSSSGTGRHGSGMLSMRFDVLCAHVPLHPRRSASSTRRFRSLPIQRSLAQCRRLECPSLVEKVTAHALDASVVLRATISVPELRPKSVPVQFILAIDVANALAEQLPIAVRAPGAIRPGDWKWQRRFSAAISVAPAETARRAPHLTLRSGVICRQFG
jgi:hypothetical protein